MNNDIPNCPKCECEYTYHDGTSFVCPECAYEWTGAEEAIKAENTIKVIDANGNQLSDGDNVVVIKDLKVKGSSGAVKQGTMVKNISLTDEAGHNIACKIAGFGAINLKSEFVKKV